MNDLTPFVFKMIEAFGLQPGKDEFKSSSMKINDETNRTLLDKLREIPGIAGAKIGLVVVPNGERDNLGSEALRGLRKILKANKLEEQEHKIYFDEGISFKNKNKILEELGWKEKWKIFIGQDSKLIGGLQMADLSAHTMSVMLLEALGIVNKKVRAGEKSGYEPDLEMEIGFELWASLRYHFFTMDRIKPELSQLEAFTLDIGAFAIYISDSCSGALRDTVMKRFNKCYVGCIH